MLARALKLAPAQRSRQLRVPRLGLPPVQTLVPARRLVRRTRRLLPGRVRVQQSNAREN